jgi:hypothetical protein
MADPTVERFRPTSGRVTGVIALLVVLAVVVIGVADRESGFPVPVVTGALVVGVLVWAATLRPRVWLTERSLVLRGMVDTVSIPLAAIEEIVVRQVLAVRAGDRRYVSPAVGRSWRQTLKSNKRDPNQVDPARASYPDFVEQRIRSRADDARAKSGIARYSDEQVALAAGIRRELAWPEIIALVVVVVAFVATLVF